MILRVAACVPSGSKGSETAKDTQVSDSSLESVVEAMAAVAHGVTNQGVGRGVTLQTHTMGGVPDWLTPIDRGYAVLQTKAQQPAMSNTETPPLIVPDYRRPGQPLSPWTLRMPPELTADLEQQANRLQTSSAGLARALLARGVKDLKAS